MPTSHRCFPRLLKRFVLSPTICRVEPLDPRIQAAEMRGDEIRMLINDKLVAVRLGEDMREAYERGNMSFNTICNKMLQEYDKIEQGPKQTQHENGTSPRVVNVCMAPDYPLSSRAIEARPGLAGTEARDNAGDSEENTMDWDWIWIPLICFALLTKGTKVAFRAALDPGGFKPDR